MSAVELQSDLGVVVYSMGLSMASVCAPADVSCKDVERAVNFEHPTGIASRWQISDDEKFADGEHTNPCACNSDPERLHWLLEC